MMMMMMMMMMMWDEAVCDVCVCCDHPFVCGPPWIRLLPTLSPLQREANGYTSLRTLASMHTVEDRVHMRHGLK